MNPRIFSLLALLLLTGFAIAAEEKEFLERIQIIAKGQVAAAFSHKKNAGILTTEEIAAIVKLIRAGLPFTVVRPETLEEGRYFDLKNQEALTKALSPELVVLLDYEGNLVDARVVRDKLKRRFIIQWDEKSLAAVLEKGKVVPDRLVQDVAHEAIRYAYHIGEIQRNDDARFFTKKMYYPPPDESDVLPSANYRFDGPRRLKVCAASYRELIGWLETDLKFHSESTPALRGLKESLETGLRGVQMNQKLDETLANHLDMVERSILQQRECFLEQINHGHIPIERPENLQRLDFQARAQLLMEYCYRIDDMIMWHHGLRERQDGQDYLDKYQRLGTDWFLKFNRAQWKMKDAELADLFDKYERMLGSYLVKWRKEFPIRQ